MRYIILLVICLFSTLINAQQYNGSFEAGVTNGKYETNAFVNTTHGFIYKGFFAGVGVGVDYYLFRTVPLFAEFRKEFSKKNVRPLVHFSGGININWLTQEQRDHRFSWWQTTPSVFKNGMYLKAGTGVLFNAHKQIKFATTVSWSYKTLTEKYTDRLLEPWPQPGNNLTERTLLYQLQRLDLGVKIIF